MADGEIKIKVSVDGKDVEATVEGMDKMQGSTKKATAGMKEFTAAMVAVKIGAAALSVLNDALSDSIKRFDTIERYPKVMESLGYSTEVSAASIEKLSSGIEGLPTTLDSVVSSVQKMTTITGNLNKSTDAVLALNNSFMANGASTADAERGMVQYLQMLSKGTVDIVSWRTLQETMGVALRRTAEAMGYLGSNGVNQLYAALQSGKTTFAEFQDNLISIATGTGEIAQLAQENSKGIATSFTNLRTAVVRNLADLVKVFDEMSQEITGKSIADNINSLKGVINSAFGAMKSVVRGSTPVFKTFSDVVKGTVKVVKSLAPQLMGVASAYAALKIISTVSGLITKSNALIKTAKATQEGLTTITLLHTSAIAKEAAAKGADIAVTKAQTLVQAAQNGTIGIGTAAIGLLTGALTTHEVVTIAATAATKALTAAIGFLTSPIGLVVSALGVLVSALSLGKEHYKELSDVSGTYTGRLIEQTSKATEKIKENTAAQKASLEDIDNSTQAYKDLIDELEGLAQSENKSASEKERMETIVKSLNNSVDGLGLAYDKENDNLSISSGLLKERVELMQAARKAEEGRKNAVQNAKDLNVAESALNDLYERRKVIEKDMNENQNQVIKGYDARRKMMEDEVKHQAELDSLNIKIKEEEQNYANLKETANATNASIAESQAIVDAAVQNGVTNQVMSYALLSDSQKEAVDSMNAKWLEYEEQATNMFDVLSDKQEMSAQDMINNMIENQRVMSEWADNISILADRGVNQGLLDKLRDAGPESAGYVAALVTASDEQLQQLNTVFESGGTTATDSLKKAFDFEGSGIPESITALVTQTQESLRTQMSAADFASLGSDVGTGLSQGISNNTEAVRGSSEVMGANVSTGVAAGIGNNQILVEDSVTRLINGSIKSPIQTQLDMHSPSRVTEGYGKNIDAGLGNGISNNKELVLSQIRSLVEDMKSAFRNSYSDFMQIGSYLMDGLAIGIRNNADTAVSAAEAAAKRVKEATEGSYIIGSPSKWMKDWVAKYMMIGQAKGLEKYANIPVKAMEKVSEAIKLPAITAEAAIGSGFQAQMYSPQVVNKYSNTGNAELARAIYKLANRPITTSIEIGAREVVKATAVPMQEQLTRNQTFKNMMNGVRT
ncbi:tape measure protein [Faecalicatena contorta]|uniref:Tape measure domain-containing protein n=1 Tax=Faecalicatena contorta TaxID=39482 RepID=A0A316AHI9_9FIRM|nr:tape measure protein [Faecalicatena contorta]PWJ49357.1 tape measure domain-containing protein [Faecalicatena contorta]SUQ14601.1 tape measure domain-containing protein [Faecalicatena contorta]